MVQTKWPTLLLLLRLHPHASSPGLLCRADLIPHNLGTLATAHAGCRLLHCRQPAPPLFQDNYDFAIQEFDKCTAQSPFDSQLLLSDTQSFKMTGGQLAANNRQQSILHVSMLAADKPVYTCIFCWLLLLQF
jgi:hypothetical protein